MLRSFKSQHEYQFFLLVVRLPIRSGYDSGEFVLRTTLHLVRRALNTQLGFWVKIYIYPTKNEININLLHIKFWNDMGTGDTNGCTLIHKNFANKQMDEWNSFKNASL